MINSTRRAIDAAPQPLDARASAHLGERTEIVVQREWNGWRTARVRVSDLEDVHWLQPPGALRPLIHAYVPCTAIHSGDLSHDCGQADAPHMLLVCVLKSHVAPSIFAHLSRSADAASQTHMTPPAQSA
jgi:hypothetical protein